MSVSEKEARNLWEQRQAEAKQRRRDQFACAALTGLLAARNAYEPSWSEIVSIAWQTADRMLTEDAK